MPSPLRLYLAGLPSPGSGEVLFTSDPEKVPPGFKPIRIYGSRWYDPVTNVVVHLCRIDEQRNVAIVGRRMGQEYRFRRVPALHTPEGRRTRRIRRVVNSKPRMYRFSVDLQRFYQLRYLPKLTGTFWSDRPERGEQRLRGIHEEEPRIVRVTQDSFWNISARVVTSIGRRVYLRSQRQRIEAFLGGFFWVPYPEIGSRWRDVLGQEVIVTRVMTKNIHFTSRGVLNRVPLNVFMVDFQRIVSPPQAPEAPKEEPPRVPQKNLWNLVTEDD